MAGISTAEITIFEWAPAKESCQEDAIAPGKLRAMNYRVLWRHCIEEHSEKHSED